MVLHALAVDPQEKGKGLGRAFYTKQQGFLELRMDTSVKCVRARRLYQLLSYREVGVVSSVFNGIPDVQLVCLEKFLGRCGGRKYLRSLFYHVKKVRSRCERVFSHEGS